MRKYTQYPQLKAELNQLREQAEFRLGIDLLEAHKSAFPAKLYDILFNQVINAMLMKDHDLALDIHEQIVENGFCTVVDWDLFDPIRATPRYQAVLQKSRQFKAQLQQQASRKVEVFTPPGYQPNQQYPLFIALHGDSNDLTTFKDYWPPELLLKHGFIVLYVQSSQVICTDGFGWVPDYAITNADIKAAFEQVCNDYSVDDENVLVGGFSGGAIAAIEVTMANSIPAKGFISLCPSIKPDGFSQAAVEQAVARGVKGVMMEGENDGEVPAEVQMMQTFDDCGLPYYFHVNPGIGHAFPDDFADQLDRALAFVKG